MPEAVAIDLAEPCPRCGREVRVTGAGVGVTRCRRCQGAIDFLPLPGLSRPAGPARGEAAVEGEATCFHHPHKRAEVECARCGRFLCGLCAVRFGEVRVCPDCLGKGMQDLEVRGAKLEQGRFLPGTAGLYVGLLSTVIFFAAPLTWPVTLWLAIRGLRQKPGPFPRSKAAAWIALLLGVVHLGFAVILLESAIMNDHGSS